MQIEKQLQDLTRLQWSRIRHSSGTAGSFLKAQEEIDGVKMYYKLSNYNIVEGIIGHECVNEILVDRLLDYLNFNHLQYRLIHAKILVNTKEYITYICASEDYKEKGESKTAMDLFYEMEMKKGETPYDFCQRMGWEEQVIQMLTIDYLILNRDRHGANIEVLRNRKKKTTRLAPLFDHGLSLVFQCLDDNALERIDVLEDKVVQAFLGTHSVAKNLQLIPMEKRIKLPSFDETFHKNLFADLEGIISKQRMDKIWEMITKRADQYENISNQR